ncbi:MAG: ATP-binding protein [Bacteroidetes bacterium]|jgi:signal transduction histidine kinase|nr:ATP-binding protein [Bacteroidota bacterium]
MPFVVYRVAAFLVMLSITSFTLFYPGRDRGGKLAGWNNIRAGLVLITAGLALSNLRFLVGDRWRLPYDIVRYFGLYLCGICLAGYGIRKLIPGILEYRSALESRDATNETNKFSRHLLKLEENSMALASPGSMHDVLRRIVSKGAEIAGAYLSVLLLFDPRSDIVDSGYYSGEGLQSFEKLAAYLDINLKNLELLPDKMGFLRKTAESRRLYSGISTDEFIGILAGNRPLPVSRELAAVRQLVFVPLHLDGKADGLLCCFFAGNEYPEVLLELFGYQCSLALRNARLFEEMQKNTIALEVQRRKADNANRSKTEFLANMSHELRTPLNAIIGFSEVLQTDINDMPHEMARQFIGNINTSGRHLLELVNDLLDLSRLEIGRLKLERSHFKLPAELTQAVSIVEPMAQEKNISVVTDYKEPIESIYADPQKLRQIVINLLSNAVKFSHADGRINLKVWKKESSVYFCIEDFGMGIKSQDIDRLFKPFEQLAQNPYARKYRGVGLGLALTRRLVELHGGRVWVESQLGRGSKFFFTVPQ